MRNRYKVEITAVKPTLSSPSSSSSVGPHSFLAIVVILLSSSWSLTDFDAVLRKPTVTKLDEEAGAMSTICTVIGMTSTDIVCTDDERTGNRPLEPTAQSRQESDRGFLGGERIHGVDFDKELENGAEESQTGESLNGSSAVDENRSLETEDIRARGSLTKSNADATKAKLKIEAVEDYDAETVIKNQQEYYLYCPCCGEDITKTVRLVKKLEIQPKNGRQDVMWWFPVRIQLRFLSLFSHKKDHKGKEKIDPKPVSTSALGVSNWRLKTTVVNFLSRLLHIVALLFLYTVALLFLFIFALWFLFISPEELPSISSQHLISVFAMLFLAILALCFHLNPGNDEKKGEEKVNSKSSGPGEVSDSMQDTGPDQVSDQKQGNNKPCHPYGDKEPHRLQIEEGVSTSPPPSDMNFVVREGKHSEPSCPQESKPDVVTEQGPAEATETEPNSLPIGPEITINVPGKGGRLEILKSMVYGGLLESITSLVIVSSTAGSGASTLKIFVMGLANLSSGLTLIIQNLLELRNEKPRRTETDDKVEGRYEQLLGRRDKFYHHVFVVILSFISFGLIPPLVYGFSFKRTDERCYKAAAVLAASLLCITSLAVAKAYVSKTRQYFKTVFYYTTLATGASGISYIISGLVNDLLEKYGLYDDSAETPQR